MNHPNKRAKSTKSMNYHAEALRKVKEDRDKYRTSYLLALKLLLPQLHENCCSTHSNPPIFSCILPLQQSSQLRVVVGSHLRIKKDGKHILHRECCINVTVPTTCCIIFYHNRTLHGGGPSSGGRNTRMFSIYAKDDHYSGVDNKKYGQDIRYCDEQCKLCEKLQMLKVTNGGICKY